MTATEAGPTQRATRSGPWRIRWHGVALVAGLELKQRVRSTKWKWALGVFFLIVGAVTALIISTYNRNNFGGGPGDVVFGVVLFFVLFLGLVVSPTLSATSINGDSNDGTLAPLQVTPLSAADIVVGKLLAAWVASLAFVVVALPFVIWSYIVSEAPVGAVLTTVMVVALELLVVCALGMGWSALTARTSASAVLTYVSVASLTFLTLVFFGLTYALVSDTATVRYYQPNWDEQTGELASPGCTYIESQEQVAHTERTWWLLALNPFVIVADAAPSNQDIVTERYPDQTMLGSIKYAVRGARLGPELVHNYCDTGTGTTPLLPEEQARREQLAGLGAVWPWGLLAHGVLACGALYVAVRRVAVPHGELATGTRIA